MGSFISKDELGPDDMAKGMEGTKKHSLKGETANGGQNPEWKQINRRKAAGGEVRERRKRGHAPRRGRGPMDGRRVMKLNEQGI